MAEEEFTEKHLNEAIESLCRSKAEEFQLIGYEHVTEADIWACVSQKYDKEGFPPLHQLVNDILSLKATQFMNFMTISAFRGSRFE
ncbi:Post-transcriptional regulator ComN [compost metagenome]